MCVIHWRSIPKLFQLEMMVTNDVEHYPQSPYVEYGEHIL